MIYTVRQSKNCERGRRHWNNNEVYTDVVTKQQILLIKHFVRDCKGKMRGGIG